jgi:transcriptional regulator with XRE-family HTH domain
MYKKNIHNGIVIQVLRMIFQVKQQTLCALLENTQGTMSLIENNKSEITVLQLEQICNFFNITVKEFFELKQFLQNFDHLSNNPV